MDENHQKAVWQVKHVLSEEQKIKTFNKKFQQPASHLSFMSYNNSKSQFYIKILSSQYFTDRQCLI